MASEIQDSVSFVQSHPTPINNTPATLTNTNHLIPNHPDLWINDKSVNEGKIGFKFREEQKQNIGMKEMAEMIFKSKYARYRKDLKRRENWDEAVDRILNMHLKKYNSLSVERKNEIRWAFEKVRQKIVMPSMRSFQYGSLPIEVNHSRGYNCSSGHIASIRSFAEGFWQLLCGVGVTFGVSKKHIKKLPELATSENKTGTVVSYIIEDTIEGWSDSIEILLMSYHKNTPFTGRKIVFDFSRIRPKGAELKTTGGKAPGYKGLKDALTKVKHLLDRAIEKRHQKRLTSADISDIMCHCSDAVLSGGIRRAAAAIIFDKDDQLMINYKTNIKVDRIRNFEFDEDKKVWNGFVFLDGDKTEVNLSEDEYQILKKDKLVRWFHLEPQRGRVNISALLMKKDLFFEEFKQIVERTKQYGEPGFVFADHEDLLLNPCLSAGAVVYTKQGKTFFGNIKEGDEIWSETGWTKVLKIWSTGEKEVWEYKTGKGMFLGTENHQIVENGVKVEIGKAKNIDSLLDPEGESYYFGDWGFGDKIISKKYIGTEEVFDITVDNDPHTFWCGGLNVSNCFEVSMIPITSDGRYGYQFCNLTSQNGNKIHSLEEWLEAVKAATIIGTLQAGYTDFKYLSSASKEITEEEALLGVSLSGWYDNYELFSNTRNQYLVAKYATKINEEWASEIKINPAARVTLSKPEGSGSLVFGCSSGIHPHHSNKYFRRVQMNKLDNVYQHFKKQNPHACEESVWSAAKSDDVVSFPVVLENNEKTKKDITALEHLEFIQSVQQNYVNTGTTKYNKKPINHNISATVEVRPDEWESVIDYIFENKEFFTALSLLSSSGEDDYPQAPLQRVTEKNEAQFKKLLDNFKSVDYDKLNEEEDNTTIQQTVACAGGVCELI